MTKIINIKINTRKQIIIFACLLITHHALAKIGCMSDTHNLEQKYDSKEYHFVACACQCMQYLAQQNRCTKCGHAHLPQQLIILSSTDVADAQTTPMYVCNTHDKHADNNYMSRAHPIAPYTVIQNLITQKLARQMSTSNK